MRLQNACYAGYVSIGGGVVTHGIITPPHCRLRDASPLTATLDAQRRYGHHRGVGDVIQALIALQKFSVSFSGEFVHDSS